MLRCLVTVTLLFSTAHSLWADDLTAKLDAILDRPEYAAAKWGVLVVDAKSGKTVYERNPDKMATPASVTKLYSCAAALMAFGPDYRFETPVYRRGDVSSPAFSAAIWFSSPRAT